MGLSPSRYVLGTRPSREKINHQTRRRRLATEITEATEKDTEEIKGDAQSLFWAGGAEGYGRRRRLATEKDTEKHEGGFGRRNSETQNRRRRCSSSWSFVPWWWIRFPSRCALGRGGQSHFASTQNRDCPRASGSLSLQIQPSAAIASVQFLPAFALRGCRRAELLDLPAGGGYDACRSGLSKLIYRDRKREALPCICDCLTGPRC